MVSCRRVKERGGDGDGDDSLELLGWLGEVEKRVGEEVVVVGDVDGGEFA